MQLTCSTCKKRKSVLDFDKSNATKHKYLYSCKKCLNKQRLGRVRNSNENLINYLSEHPCIDCGIGDPLILQFDHLRDKERNIATMVKIGLRWPKIFKEIQKCEVVCANCHARRTAIRAQTTKLRLLEENSSPAFS